MNLLDLISRTALSLETQEEPEPADDFGELDPQQLDAVLAGLSIYSAAIRMLQHQAKGRFADHLGVHGFARFGDRVYRAAPKKDIKVRSDSRTEFWKFAQDHPDLIPQIFNPNNHRITGLRKLADEYESPDPETGEIREGWKAFAADFLDIAQGEVEVKELSADSQYTPKFLKKLPDGTVEKRGDIDE